MAAFITSPLPPVWASSTWGPMFVFIAQLQRIGLLPSHFPTQANNFVSDQQPDTWQNSSQSCKQCFFIHITGYKNDFQLPNWTYKHKRNNLLHMFPHIMPIQSFLTCHLTDCISSLLHTSNLRFQVSKLLCKIVSWQIKYMAYLGSTWDLHYCPELHDIIL